MNSRSKSNNFIAVLIALMLFAAGFILLFIHERSEPTGKQKPAKAATSAIYKAPSASDNSLA